MQLKLLFSAHISYGKGKYLNQTGFFFLQNLPRFYLYLNLRVLPIEFNPHKFSFVRYVFVEIFIFRPYFIWERKIFKSNGFFFIFIVCSTEKKLKDGLQIQINRQAGSDPNPSRRHT